MKNILVALLIAFAAATRAEESIDVKKATFDQLLEQWLMAGTPEHAANKIACHAELFARGPVTLSNLMNKIHIENVMVGVLASSMVKDEPLPKDQAVPALLPFLQATNPTTRKMACLFLAFYNAPEHAEEVYPLFDHERTRGAAIRTLGKWHVTNAVPRITPFLHDGKERIRVATVNALREIADTNSIPDLIGALGDPMFTVRNTAALALLRYATSARDPMIAALKKELPVPARRQLIRILGDLRDPAASDALKPLLDDADSETKLDVRRALDFIDHKRDDAFFAPGGGM